MRHKTNFQTIFRSLAGQRKAMELYHSMLAKWPVEYETREFPTHHGNTFVIVSGKDTAKPLILLHDAEINSPIWINDIINYSEHYRVYAVEIIGEAGKSSPNRPAWNSSAYQEWLNDVFDKLTIDKATIIGVSQGSWISLKFATAQPERLEKLILMCPGGIISDKITSPLRALPLMLLGQWGIKRIVKILYGNHPIPKDFY